MPSPYQHSQKKGQVFINLTNILVSLVFSQRSIQGKIIYKYIAAMKIQQLAIVINIVSHLPFTKYFKIKTNIIYWQCFRIQLDSKRYYLQKVRKILVRKIIPRCPAVENLLSKAGLRFKYWSGNEDPTCCGTATPCKPQVERPCAIIKILSIVIQIQCS